jgi:peptidoglycan/LPS O-acetylase OafA/YrhL
MEGMIEKEKAPAPIDYKFMDGLRGIGAFVVYVCHFLDRYYHVPTKKMYDTKTKSAEHMLPDWMRTTPITVLYHGYFWVVVFFVLSGFVLTLRFFKIRKATCVTGGTFRRYVRLMIPVWFIVSFYYMAIRFQLLDGADFDDKNDFSELKDKTYMDFVFDSTIGIWYGDNTWMVAVWTLSIELTATFMVYLLAQTAVEYRGRFYIYGVTCLFFLVPYYLDKWGFTDYKLEKTHTKISVIYHYPIFIFGVAIADMEMMPKRPLDVFRGWWWPYATLKNIFLLFIGISFGGHRGGSCLYENSGPCEYFRIISFDEWLARDIMMYIGGLAWIFLALTSDATQWLLGSCFFQFFGKISYSLYLVHALFVFWLQNDLIRNLYERGGMKYDYAVAIAFGAYTPVLVLVSWLLTIIVDEPYKDFAYELDMASRYKQPPVRSIAGGGEIASEKSEKRAAKFLTNSWKFFALVIYMLMVYVTTEAYSYYAVN